MESIQEVRRRHRRVPQREWYGEIRDPFITGFIENNNYLGRAADLLVLRDGSQVRRLCHEGWLIAVTSLPVQGGGLRPELSLPFFRRLGIKEQVVLRIIN
jgi:hypothetical protein